MRRFVLVLAVALVASLVPASAIGQTTTSHKVNVTLRVAAIGSNPPSGTIYAGELNGKPFRRAALTARTQVSGSTSKGRAVIYAKRGTITARIRNEIQPQQDGSVKFPGSFKVLRGTGIYRGATGKGSFDGNLAPNDTVLVFKATGKLRY